MSVRIEIRNADKLMRRLNQLPQKVTEEAKKAVETSALLIEGTAKTSVQRGPKSGEVYMHGNVAHQASAPGQPPATDAGALVSSITHKINDGGLSAEVGTYIEYGKFLEYGTVNMAARPFLFPAVERNRKAIEQLFKKALKDGVGK